MSSYRLCDICGKPITNDDSATRITIADKSIGKANGSSASPDLRYAMDIEVHINCAIDVKNDIVDRGWRHHKKQFDLNPSLVPQYLKDKVSRLEYVGLTIERS